MYLPTPMANFINGLFSPPAVYNAIFGAYQVECDAKTPAFALKVNGVILPFYGLIVPFPTLDGCFSGINDGLSLDPTDQPWVAGDIFYQNFVVQHDIGKMEMRMASR
jgi:hypothetical protein